MTHNAAVAAGLGQIYSTASIPSKAVSISPKLPIDEFDFGTFSLAVGGSGKQPSGNKVGSEAVVEALQAFTGIVTATLGDAHAQATAEAEQAQAELSPQEALNALSTLALRQQGLATALNEAQQGEQAVSFCNRRL